LLNILIAAQAYIIGGVNGAIIASKYLYRRDIRELGSGNPGLTNFYRVFGARGVLLMLLIDVAKTLGPVLLGGWIFHRAGYPGVSGRILAGLFVMLGHAFPLFYKFKGGKTVLAAGILLFSIDWRVCVLGWGMFLLMLIATRYVSLSSIVGVWGYPIALAVFRIGTKADLVVAILSAALLVARHYANIGRLISHKESKFSFHRADKE
jgi:glycerol-3-phosphate acyltransferase PlsY